MSIEMQQIYNAGERDWVALIVQSLVPIIVMIVTLIVSHLEQSRALKSQKEESQKQLDQQAKESKRQLEQQAEEHNQDMHSQKENTRLGILPIFNVVKVTSEVEEPISLSGSKDTKKRLILKISVENIGFGIAMSPTLKIDSHVSRIQINSMYESEIAYYDVYKNFTYNDAIIPPERTVEIQIAREEKDKSEPEDTFIVPILFSDVLGNEYEQRIAISFLTKIEKDNDVEIVKVISGEPVLLPKDTHTSKKEDKNVNPNLR